MFFFGGIISWVLFDYNHIINLSLFIKNFTVIGVVSLFILSFSLMNFSSIFISFKRGLIYSYFVGMFFLSFVRSFIPLKFFSLLGSFIIKGEGGWGEVLGGKGFSNLALQGGKYLQIIQYNFLYSQFILIFLLILFLFFF